MANDLTLPSLNIPPTTSRTNDDDSKSPASLETRSPVGRLSLGSRSRLGNFSPREPQMGALANPYSPQSGSDDAISIHSDDSYEWRDGAYSGDEWDGLETGATSMNPNLQGLNLGLSEKFSWNQVDMDDGRTLDVGKLMDLSGDATHVHGSRSASLLSFTNITDEGDRGKLMPFGDLMDKGYYPFSGELGSGAFAKKGINTVALSVAHIGKATSAVNYAMSGSKQDWSIADARAKLENLQSIPIDSEGAEAAEMRQNEIKLLAGQIERWERMGEGEQSLVLEDFPVFYSVQSSDGQVISRGFEIEGEAALKGGVAPENISVIFVPDDKVDAVADLVNGQAEFDHIQVLGQSEVISGSPRQASAFTLAAPPLGFDFPPLGASELADNDETGSMFALDLPPALAAQPAGGSLSPQSPDAAHANLHEPQFGGDIAPDDAIYEDIPIPTDRTEADDELGALAD